MGIMSSVNSPVHSTCTWCKRLFVKTGRLVLAPALSSARMVGCTSLSLGAAASHQRAFASILQPNKTELHFFLEEQAADKLSLHQHDAAWING